DRAHASAAELGSRSMFMKSGALRIPVGNRGSPEGVQTAEETGLALPTGDSEGISRAADRVRIADYQPGVVTRVVSANSRKRRFPSCLLLSDHLHRLDPCA